MARLVMVVEGIVLLAAVWITMAWFDGGPPGSGASAIAFALFGLLSFYYHNFYDLRLVQTFARFVRRLPSALGLWVLLLAGSHTASVLMGWSHPGDLSSAAYLAVGTGLILPVRGLFYAFLQTPHLAKRVVILGTGELARHLAAELQASPHLHYHLLGHVDDDSHHRSEPLGPMPSPVLGPLDNLAEIVKQCEPDIIIVALVERRMRLPMIDLFNARVSGTLIEDGIDLYERCTGKLALEHVVPSSFLFSRDFVKSAWLLLARRLLSCGVATAGLVLTAPLMGLIALAIKLDSQGSIFFVQDRAGLHGQPFRLVKFRTMHPPVTPVDPSQRHWASDLVRITRVGKWLRRLYLDELPQFLNILVGHMDLVGPRPEMFDNVKAMAEQIPYYALRTTVRPGLTGWAQIKQGYSVSRDEVTEKMRYDLYYIKHMSLRFDLRIGVDTVKNILLRRGT
ncbi:sugar transferase [Candidatus Entotheonella palauensis]|uniref:sugar transferase n=1 Tax=Candidatus Entotheonella palauensis TaxID=93172 RepID=UPI000B7C6030|nr:sugar transferase [Candidatus Entotheonella palauensis]